MFLPSTPLAPSSGPKRHTERAEERLALGVTARRRADHHRESLDLFHLVEIDLREDHLLAETQGVVAAAVEGAIGHALEVADTRQRNVHQPLEELEHAFTAQRDHRTDRHTLAELEVRDRLLRAGHDRFLTADGSELLDGGVEQLRVLGRFP